MNDDKGHSININVMVARSSALQSPNETERKENGSIVISVHVEVF